MTPDLDKLKELLEKATPLPWRQGAYDMSQIAVDGELHANGFSKKIATTGAKEDWRGVVRQADDAALIVAAVNSLPALIAKAERVDALMVALRNHGKHDGLCARIGGYGYCSCGLEAELDALSPKSASPDAPKRPGFRDAWRRRARAAIEGMRDPPEHVLEAGCEAWTPGVAGDGIRTSWNAMIDAALSTAPLDEETEK